FRGSIVIPSSVSITNSFPVASCATQRSYALTLTPSGGVGPYSWALTGGSFPAGVTLNTSTGVISGTPTASGTFAFTVRVTDASSQQATISCSIVIASALSITNSCPVASGIIN